MVFMRDNKDNEKDPHEQYKQIKKGLDYISLQMEILRSENKELRANNKALERHIEELKQDKEMLMKIAMKTPDSIAFPQIAHYVNFALIEVLKDKDTSDEEKLTNLKMYLKPSLDNDVHQALHYIEKFKQDHAQYEDILNELTSWIKYIYRLN